MTEPKMTEKPPTMRKLTEQVAEGVAALVRDVETRNSAKTINAAPKPYTEADALAACIHALAVLKEAESRNRSSSNSYAMPMDFRPTWAAGDRILRFLAARFDVSLIEIRRPACERAHVDALRPDAFFNALAVASQPAL